MVVKPFPQPPYVGDAWTYDYFDEPPGDAWELVSIQEDGQLFMKHQVQFRESLDTGPSWALYWDYIDGQLVKRWVVDGHELHI